MGDNFSPLSKRPAANSAHKNQQQKTSEEEANDLVILHNSETICLTKH